MNAAIRSLSISAIQLAIVGTAWAQPTAIRESFTVRSGAKYVVRLRQERPARLNDLSFQRYGHWGAEGAQASFCTSSLTVSRRGAPVRVSGKAFTDLCNIHSVQLSERNGLFLIAMRGGDAADSFTAEFSFRGVYLIERMVRHSEFPESYERTIYRYNTYDN